MFLLIISQPNEEIFTILGNNVHYNKTMWTARLKSIPQRSMLHIKIVGQMEKFSFLLSISQPNKGIFIMHVLGKNVHHNKTM